MSHRYFYHCFPRRAGPDRTERALSILASVVERGLLLTHERIEMQELLADGSLGKRSLILQKRLCFTELAPNELPQHCAQFGPFAIEWDIPTLIQMGAVPVFYVPLRGTAGTNDGIATSMLARLGEVQVLLSRLESLSRLVVQASNPQDTLNITRNEAFVASTTCTVSCARDLLEYLQAEIQPIPALTAAVRHMFGYFYPTENLSYTGPLAYYRQREWRLLANATNCGVPVTEPVSEKDVEALTRIDPDFFSRELDFPSGRRMLASECHLYRSFRGRHALEAASRLIVPQDAADSVRRMLADADMSIEVVPIEKYG